jgi:hypothetical protein
VTTASATEQRLLAAAEAANELIRTAHERLDCPRCGMPKGRRCVRVGMGRPVELKHSHQQRWEQEVPAR